jgi:hypothetical protein
MDKMHAKIWWYQLGVRTMAAIFILSYKIRTERVMKIAAIALT